MISATGRRETFSRPPTRHEDRRSPLTLKRRLSSEPEMRIRTNSALRDGLLTVATEAASCRLQLIRSGGLCVIPRKKAEEEVGGLARLRRRADDGAVVLAQYLEP